MENIKWTWQQVAVFVTVFLVCGALVWFGRAHVEILLGPLGLLVPGGPMYSRAPTKPPEGAP